MCIWPRHLCIMSRETSGIKINQLALPSHPVSELYDVILGPWPFVIIGQVSFKPEMEIELETGRGGGGG